MAGGATGRVDIEDLVVAYGGKRVLGPIDLSVKPGEFVVIVGASGCGKSTLLNAVGGHVQAAQGSVRLAGKLVERPQRTVATVFQKANLFPWLSVRDNVALGLKLNGMSANLRRQRADEMLELVGLGGLGDRPPYELSGGMQQRVALARALAGKPSLLLMDEPFSALDAITRVRMQNELVAIWKRTGTTIIFITHDVDEALALGQRVVVLGGSPGVSRFELDTASYSAEPASSVNGAAEGEVRSDDGPVERSRILRELAAESARHEQAEQAEQAGKAAAAPRSGRRLEALRMIALGLTVPIAVAVAWVLAVRTEAVSPTFLPSPETVWDTSKSIITDGYRGTPIWQHLWTSMSNVAISFVVVTLIAVPLGFFMGLNRSVQAVADPIVEFIRPLPPLAYLTLLVIWLGIGQTTQVTLLAVTAFPILTAAARSAAMSVPEEMKKTARSFGASRVQVFREVIVRASLPEVLTGLRVVVGVMFATVIAAEMVAARGGIGWMILDASRFLRADVIFFGIFLMILIGFSIDRLFRVIERLWAPWRGKG
jgi:ABC-type nitrate/sulfonate/bicarbonate transport system ATPase subunit/ABC-type nitrate/sulfonate/bicarbonate transport system permease component